MAESKLKKAINDLNEAVQDLTSLHVQTFTGDFQITVEDNDGKKKGYTTIKDEIENAKNNSDGTFILVAESLAQFDGDSYNYVKQDLTDIPSLALEVHKNAVTAGIETRLGLLKLFFD